MAFSTTSTSAGGRSRATSRSGTGGGKAVQCGRMGVNNIERPFAVDVDDALFERTNFAPFAQAGRAGNPLRRAEKMQPFRFLRLHGGLLPMLVLANPGYAANLPACTGLRFQDRARAKGIAAVQRQAVVEYMKDTSHAAP
jgi:hypothetical protein